MKNMYYTLRTLCLVFTLMVTGSFVTSRALGDDVPTFSDPDVTNFVKTYSDFVNDYIDAYKAAKAGDNSKITALQAKAPQLQAQAAQVAGKLKPEESSKFQTFVTACSQKMLDAMK
jgi:hypothetical protein